MVGVFPMSLGTIIGRYSPQDLDAVLEYVQAQRSKIDKHPSLLPLIESFEKWFQVISWYERFIDTDETMQAARRRREKINDVLGEKIPDTWVPADSPAAVPSAALLSKLLSSIPNSMKVGLVLSAGVAGAIMILTGLRKI